MKNPLLNIPISPLFEVPINFPDTIKKSYLTQLKYRFDQIIYFLDSCKNYYYAPDDKIEVITRVKGIQKALIDIINEYFNGHPSVAFAIFENAIEYYKLNDELLSTQQISIPSDSLFFRTQRQYDKILKASIDSTGFLSFKTNLELFHTPFERRRSVGTYRFSISGYPSLYASQALLTSYSECFPNDEYGAFHAICLKNIRPLYFIDLTQDNFKNNKLLFKGILPRLTSGEIEKDDVSGILEYLGIHQLIIASHTKVAYKPAYSNEKFYFKAEYIIPQLLLQWIQLKGLLIDGIQYKSCTGSAKFKSIEHYNYILPVKSNMTKGFCPSLKSIFYCSGVYSHLICDKPKDSAKLLLDIEKQLSNSNFTPLV